VQTMLTSVSLKPLALEVQNLCAFCYRWISHTHVTFSFCNVLFMFTEYFERLWF
jgi:hypothetical protein